MRVVLKERSFLLFFAASVISLLGDWALLIALPFFVYGRTRSVLATGGLVVAELLPRLLLSSVAGVLADRWNRRLTVVGVNLFRAGLVLLILLPARGGGIWLVYVVAVVQSVAAQLFVSASGALLPTIVSRSTSLLAANSLLTTGASVTRLVGPPLGGLLYVALGLSTSTVADSASFLLAAAALVAVRSVVPAATAGPVPAGPTVLRLGRELVEGARYVATRQDLAALCVIVGVAMVAQGILSTVLVPFARDVLHFDAVEYGVLSSAEGIGALAGAFGVGMLRRHLRRGVVVGWALMVTGLFTLGFAFARHLVVSAAFLLALCASSIVVQVWMQTFFQQRVDNHLLGRVIGLTENVAALGILCGVAVAALLSALIGVGVPLIAGAAALFAAGVVAVGALRDARTVDAEPAQQITVEMPSG